MTRSISTCIFLITLLAAISPLVAQTTALSTDSGFHRTSAATPRIMVSDVAYGQWPVTSSPTEKFFIIKNTSTDGGVLIVTGVAGGPSNPAVFRTPAGYPVFPLVLTAGMESDRIRVTFDPAAPIVYRDSIVFNHNAGTDPANDSVAHLTGVGIHSLLAATSTDWSRYRVGTVSDSAHVILSNVGTQDIQITGATAIGDLHDFQFDFSAVENLTLRANTSITIKVAFSPAKIGPRQMIVTYHHSTGGAAVSSTLKGIGVAPTLYAWPHYFGAQSIGTADIEQVVKFFMVPNGSWSYLDSVTITRLELANDPEESFRYELYPGQTLPYVLNGLDDTLKVRAYFTAKTEGAKYATLTAVTQDTSASGLLLQAESRWWGQGLIAASACDAAGSAGLRLGPVAPTPTEGWTTVSYTVPSISNVEITIADINGRTVATLLEKSLVAEGPHTIRFDASTLPAGSYFCRMSLGGKILTHPLVVR